MPGPHAHRPAACFWGTITLPGQICWAMATKPAKSRSPLGAIAKLQSRGRSRPFRHSGSNAKSLEPSKKQFLVRPHGSNGPDCPFGIRGSGKSSSITLHSRQEIPSMESRTSSARILKGSRPLLFFLRGGQAAGTKSTLRTNGPSSLQASSASLRWPMWTGLKLPP